MSYIDNKPKKEIKWNHKKYSSCPKEGRKKRKQKTKNR